MGQAPQDARGALLKAGMGRERRLARHLSGLASAHPSLDRDWALQPPYCHLGLCPSWRPGPAHTWVTGLTGWPGGWDLWPPGAAGNGPRSPGPQLCSLTRLPREKTAPGQPLLPVWPHFFQGGSPGPDHHLGHHACPTQAHLREAPAPMPTLCGLYGGDPAIQEGHRAVPQPLCRWAPEASPWEECPLIPLPGVLGPPCCTPPHTPPF